MVKEWITKLTAYQIPHSDNPELVRVLGDAVKIRNWQLAGLIDGDAFINQYELSLTLHFSQVSVLYMLRERFGETVVWAPGKNAFRWRITRANELQGVAKLFIYFCFLV